MFDSFPGDLASSIPNTYLFCYTCGAILSLTAIVFMIIAIVIRCCTKGTVPTQAAEQDRIHAKNTETALKIYNNATQKVVSHEALVAQIIDKTQKKKKAKKGQATRQGFGGLTRAEVGEIELTSGGNLDAGVDVREESVEDDEGLEVEVGVTAEIEVQADTQVEVPLISVDVVPEHEQTPEMVQNNKAKNAVTYIFFLITRVLMFFAFTCLAFIPPIFSGFNLMPWWLSGILTFVIFIFAIICDKASKSSRRGCCNKFCHCWSGFNEVKLEAYFIIFSSVILTILSVVAFDNSCIVFGSTKHGVQGTLFGQKFTYTSPVIRKFTRFEDPCDKYNFCSMYLTLPNMPYKSSTSMVVNLMSVYPSGQTHYEGYKKKLDDLNTKFKDRLQVHRLLENLKGQYIEMTLHWGELKAFKETKRLEFQMDMMKNVKDPKIWYRRIGNHSTQYQIHSLLLKNLKPNTEYKLVLNVNGKNITEITQSPFSNGSVFKTSPDDTKNLERDPLELMIGSNFPSELVLPDKYYTQTIDAMVTGGNAIKDGGEMSCLFLWTEFLKFLDLMRSKTHHERLIPFAIGVSDGESGYNINSKFAMGSEDEAVYRSAQVFGDTAKEMGAKYNKVQLYRYFFPL